MCTVVSKLRCHNQTFVSRHCGKSQWFITTVSISRLRLKRDCTHTNQISSCDFHLNQQGRQSSRLLAAEVCASVVVMLDTPCSEGV